MKRSDQVFNVLEQLDVDYNHVVSGMTEQEELDYLSEMLDHLSIDTYIGLVEKFLGGIYFHSDPRVVALGVLRQDEDFTQFPLDPVSGDTEVPSGGRLTIGFRNLLRRLRRDGSYKSMQKRALRKVQRKGWFKSIITDVRRDYEQSGGWQS